MRLSVLIATSLMSAPAFAADLGIYRPGTPYHSVIVPTANICESQCAGDARCRSWNYVKASTEAPGVCEFQSNAGPAISSAISISGVSQTATPLSDRLIQGGTNTIRVGTSVAPTPQPSVSQQGQRQIVRQPVPSGATMAPQMAMRAPQRFQPALDDQSGHRAVGQAQPNAPYAAARAPAVTRGPARQPYTQRQMAPAPQGAQPQPMMRPGGRPPIGQPIGAPQPEIIQTNAPRPSTAMNMPRSSVQRPVTWQNAQQFQTAPPTATPAPQAPTQPMTAQPQPAPPQGDSLYGRLNDDVTTQPMPTVASAPTMPVAQSPLAGGPPR